MAIDVEVLLREVENPSLHWKRQQYTITCRDNPGNKKEKPHRVPVMGYVCEVDMLLIRRYPRLRGFKSRCAPLTFRRLAADLWQVDHVPTGCGARNFNSRRQCERFIEEAFAYDWNFRSPKSKKIVLLGPHVKEIASRVMREVER